jgi:hypothetical protein
MNQLMTIGTINIRQDEHGRYCLNDLHRAAGGARKHQPANFLRLDTTKALIGEIDRSSDMRIGSANTVKGGSGTQGSFVCRELVYAYAMWISAAFHLKVIRSYDALMTGKQPPAATVPASNSNELVLLRQLYATQARLIELMEVQLKPKPRRTKAAAWTDDEIRTARAMKAQGMSQAEIARRLKRSESSISMLTRELH